jgi:WD40 repeat protein
VRRAFAYARVANTVQTVVSSRWTFHSGRIGALAFSPNSKRLVSGGLDESIYIWSTEKHMKNIAIKVSGLRLLC